MPDIVPRWSDAELGEALEGFTELFCELFAGIEQRHVFPGPGDEVAGLFDHTLEESGIGPAAVVEEFRRCVLPNAMNTPHPLYLGLVNCSPLPAAALGDALVSAINNNGGARHQSPAGSAAEREVLRVLGELCYGDVPCTGMFVPGGSYANLQGLLLARQSRLPEWDLHGPQRLAARPRVYVSACAHFSCARAAQVAGLGAENVVPVDCDARGAMMAAALAAAVEADANAGHRPLAVIATAGTTGTGAIDPLGAIADECAARELWLHVDAAYGGGALLLKELRDRFAGIACADSLTVDAHKWFFTPVVAGVVLTRHTELDRHAFRTEASYIPGETSDPFRRGIGTSRRCTGLTTWLALRAHGLGVVRDAVRRNIRVIRHLERRLQHRGFRVLPGGELSIACARWEPAGWSAPDTDRLQGRIAEHCVASGVAWFSTVVHGGRSWLRFNAVNLYVTEEHMERLVEALETAVSELAGAAPD